MSYAKPKLIVSRCLNYAACRFDGSKIHSVELENLEEFVEIKTVCPEMDIGLASPRDALRLVKEGENLRLIQHKTGVDYTEDMTNYARKIASNWQKKDIDGFVLKGRSPSCGIKDVKAYKSVEKSPCLSKNSKGIFAEHMIQAFPQAFFEDEGRLSNFSIREHFYTAIFTVADYKQRMQNPSMKALVDFQAKNKYLFMAYSQNQTKVLGSLVANHDKKPLKTIKETYLHHLIKLLEVPPHKGRNINMMMHVFGYFSQHLKSEEKAMFLDALEDYRVSHIPKSSVMTMLYAWVLRFDSEYLKQQTVFYPFPKELIRVTDSGKGVL